MTVTNTTASREYQLPDATNQLSEDVLRLIAALNGVDEDIALLFVGLAGKAASTHSHAISDVTGLQSALDSKLGSGSSFGIENVSGLQSALDAKAPVNNATFTGTTSGVTPAAGANNTQFATTAWVRGRGYLTEVSLTANVTGSLPVANGGTGRATLTQHALLKGNGTSNVDFIAPGTAGQVLQSDGTSWGPATLPAAASGFPAGTAMLFAQTSAPTGWTKATTHNNKALRVVSGTAGSGGSVNFTTAFGSQNVGATTLTTAQIPAHVHSYSGIGDNGSGGFNAGNGDFSSPTSSDTSSIGGGESHTHSLNLAVQYVDVIIATKD